MRWGKGEAEESEFGCIRRDTKCISIEEDVTIMNSCVVGGFEEFGDGLVWEEVTDCIFVGFHCITKLIMLELDDVVNI